MPITLETLNSIANDLERVANPGELGKAPPLWESYEDTIRRAATLHARVRDFKTKVAALMTANAEERHAAPTIEQFVTEAVILTRELIEAWKELGNDNQVLECDWSIFADMVVDEGILLLNKLDEFRKQLASRENADFDTCCTFRDNAIN